MGSELVVTLDGASAEETLDDGALGTARVIPGVGASVGFVLEEVLMTGASDTPRQEIEAQLRKSCNVNNLQFARNFCKTQYK